MALRRILAAVLCAGPWQRQAQHALRAGDLGSLEQTAPLALGNCRTMIYLICDRGVKPGDDLKIAS
jgi:hypothetical protein